jgi:serine/threonine-protein kinase
MLELPESGTSRYAVQGPIGRGGMGAVFRVTDRITGAELALKRLRLAHDEKRDRKLIALFQQEFRTLAQLAHPNVVTVHDFGTDEEGPYYTMELLHGEHLHALAPMPWAKACGLLRDVCSAVALLHSRGLLHRDLSPKNIQCTSQGRVKLIDFGAMAPMGPCTTIVGTPPFVPPEALLQQALDARADLYAIGGTLYYALTGKHAYPANNMALLGATWRSPPSPPSAHVPGIPTDLDHLVLALLSLERLARPASAAEVFERLTAIAGLCPDEQVAVPRAYLATPELVGRSDELARVRRRLTDLHAGYGSVLAIEGAGGMGRSRMLDTCVLEAKLAHVFVARASAVDAATGEYGVLGALARQLAAFPRGETERPEAFLSMAEGRVSAEDDGARRAELQAAFQQEVKAVARVQPVLIAIDDIDRCDEPSLAALAAAVSSARDRVLLAASCLNAEQRVPRPTLEILLQDAARVRLAPLEPAESAALLGSVFGDVPNLQVLATRIHERAEGSPRDCMELSQYLLERNIVRYAKGSWVVPASLAETELPRTLSAARKEKLVRLSADARELAEALALCQGTALETAAFVELTAHRDAERTRDALDELLLAQIVREESASYVFAAQLWRDELQSSAAPERVRAACRRLAGVLTRRGRDRLELARFRFRAGDGASALDALLAELHAGTRWDRAPHDYAKLLRKGIDACKELARPRSDRIALLRELVKVGQDLASPDLREHSIDLLAELRHDSGLIEWEEPGGPSEPVARLRHVCELAQQRYDHAPARERGLGQLEAIIALAQLASETYAVAARTGDATLFGIVPSLRPFYPLAPVIRHIEEWTAPACRAVVAGRYEEALVLYQRQLAEMQDPNAAGVPEQFRLWGIRALNYALGSIEASFGRERALVHAAALKDEPGWHIAAFSIRQVYHLSLGNLRQAERYRKRTELALLQSPVKPPFAAAAVFQHVFVFVVTENPNGLRKALPELEALAVSNPGMRAFVPYARAEHARICGNYAEALAFIAEAQAMVKPGEHPVWVWLVSAYLFTLFAQGRYEEARVEGLRALETAAQHGQVMTRSAIEVALALNEAKAGHCASACERLERVIAEGEAFGLQGVPIGARHEIRARIAAWMNDKVAFEHHAQLCVRHLHKSGAEPAFAARYQRLMQIGRQHGLVLKGEAFEVIGDEITVRSERGTTVSLTSIGSALTACNSREQRLRRALELLVESSAAQHGELFIVTGTGLSLAASTGEGLGGTDHIPILSRIVDVGNDDASAFTAAFDLQGPAQPDGSPTQVWPLLIAEPRSSATAIAGIATLHFAPSAAIRLSSELASVIAATLIDAGDVTPHIRSASSTTVDR